jgi:hypothetical protein
VAKSIELDEAKRALVHAVREGGSVESRCAGMVVVLVAAIVEELQASGAFGCNHPECWLASSVGLARHELENMRLTVERELGESRGACEN